MEQKFKELIEKSQSILVITHVGPDPDAFCSLLLMGTALLANFPDKQIAMSVEEQTGDLDFLAGYNKIQIQPLDVAIDRAKPDLVVMVDAMNLNRCTRGDAAKVLKKLESIDAKLAIIDHHEQAGVEPSDIYINQGSPAAVQDVYEVLFDHLKLRKPDGYGETTMLGIYSDTGGFVYENSRYRETLKLVGDLIEAGVSIEKVKTQLDCYSEDSMLALAELTKNLKYEDDHSYSYVSDEFTRSWQSAGLGFNDLKMAVSHFTNSYIRNIGGRAWGFVVYRDLPGGNKIYGVSLRAMGGKDVSVIAKLLGGGGHKPAAGAKIKAANIQDALNQVKIAIHQVK